MDPYVYERSEPIVETFGESDVKIDYRLVDYVDENKSEDGWSGFHRIERILWENNTTDGTDKYAGLTSERYQGVES